MRAPSKRAVVALLIVAVAGLAVAAQLARAPSKVSAAFDGAPALTVATFSSEWCASCRVLKPTLAKAMPRFSGAPVKFVEYDFTFGETEALRARAEADGVGATFDRFAGATGFSLIVDAASGEIVDTLTMNHSAEAMAAAIDDALAAARARNNDLYGNQ